VVEMTMSDQDLIQAFETDAGLQNLALGAFTAVN
jgi:hypothetical protein